MPKKSDTYSVIGTRQPRLDGPFKATGRSQFTDDVILPGTLHGKIVRSPVTRGKIRNIDTSRAEIGSSATTSSGSITIALANPILCLCPPENS